MNGFAPEGREVCSVALGGLARLPSIGANSRQESLARDKT
jgi:hypothetical protein